MHSSMAAAGVGEDLFLLALVFGLCWTTFHPSGAGVAAMDVKGLGGPWKVVGEAWAVQLGLELLGSLLTGCALGWHGLTSPKGVAGVGG